ncbi:hypothetical protein B9Z55_014484 [Caenorhabditis nigoni]|uniref:Uncharacterized protein n=1 Tax=Caenorhabditis nigoni TaxID=1611254 RepID=A0A2G5U620_9PELO|nr:hypothetical protein B9Z55_014484 [Caenorhabditis nigoni]
MIFNYLLINGHIHVQKAMGSNCNCGDDSMESRSICMWHDTLSGSIFVHQYMVDWIFEDSKGKNRDHLTSGCRPDKNLETLDRECFIARKSAHIATGIYNY